MRIRPAPGKRPDEFRRCAIRLASGRPGPSRTGPGGVCGAWEKGPGAAGRRARSGGACRLALWRRSVSARRAGPPSASTSAREGLRGPRRVCAVLTGSGCRTGPVHLTRAARSRPPSALSISDAAPGSGRDPRPGGGEPLRRVRRSPASAGAGGTVRTTASRRPGTGSPLGPHAPRLPPPPGADRRWVVDFTRVPTQHGAPAAPPSSRGLFSRRIVGWATNARTGHRSRRGRAAALAPGYQRAHGAPTSYSAPPGQAIRARKDHEGGDLESLVRHSDHGSQYLSIALHRTTRRRGHRGIRRSRGIPLRGRRRPGPGQAPASAGPVLARRPLEGPRRPPGPPPPDR